MRRGAGAIKKLMIGSFIMIFVLMGGITMVGEGFTIYSVNDSMNASGVMLNNTINYLGTLNTTAKEYENTTTGAGAINQIETTWIGVVFSNLGGLVQSFSLMTGFLTIVVADLTNTPIINMPWYISGIILGIIGVLIFITVVAVITNRSSDDI